MKRWLALLVFVALAAGLYKAKTDAVKKRAEIARLEQEVREERAALRTLRAEIAHLENPARVESLAKENLDLQVDIGSRPRPASAIGSDLPPAKSK
jgi:cell division protein FtsL